ncbi:hypothetical protein SISNIDRAFT_481193 [Sistotremastrum niveocremeum HHB9708]|uniref:snRNA-activating protein complex subunit 3 n=1 Tax=Sistotremastrum niveocremeum HHB9708 TaxID=1314777 RepID=A0A165A425_9AGAM|nr:hypothetical protein SISNIDRAFT_481193 [Sistotremastrum niveocremeum HHB9708]
MFTQAFGPFSSLVDLTVLLDTADANKKHGFDVWNTAPNPSDAISKWKTWLDLPDTAKAAIERECDVGDIAAELDDTLEKHNLYSHLSLERKKILSDFDKEHAKYQPKKRKRVPDEVYDDPDIDAFKEKLENISLECWSLPPQADLFVRRALPFEHNALSKTKECKATSSKSLQAKDVLLYITVYDKSASHPYQVWKSSSHILPSTSTLEDIWNAIPCPAKEYPEEVLADDGSLVEFDTSRTTDRGPCFCVHGATYGDGGDAQYAQKVLDYLATCKVPPNRPRVTLKPGGLISDTTLDSLPLILHFPNWILHNGNCEHYFAVTHIRLRHPSDPVDGYPLTTHLTPVSRGLCRICDFVPASHAIVNDLRLDDSPFVVCKRCLDFLGEPTSYNDSRLVVPLVEHKTW